MEEKTHFKMYKAKTKWMVAGVTMFSTMLGAGALANIHADNVSSSGSSQLPITDLNSQSKSYQANLQNYQKQQNQGTAVKSSVEISSKPSQPVSIAEQSNAQYDSQVNAYQQAKSASTNSNSTVISPTAKAVPVKSATTVSSAASTPALAVHESTSNNSTNNSDQPNVVASNPGPNQVIIGSGNNNQANNQDKQVYYNNVSDAPSQPYHQADNLVDAGFTTDKAVYNPGDTVHASLTIKNMNNYNQWGVYKLNVFNPLTQETTVASGNWKVDQGQSQTLNVDWTTPKIDDQGYVLDFQLFTSTGDLLNEFTNAVDVDTDPYKHPRYGALTDFSGNDIAKEKAMVDSLAKNYHLNMQMLYDCYFEPQNPLPNQDSWKDWHGDTISKQAIQDIINEIHQDGGKAFLYDMIGATSDKSMPQTGFYNPDNSDWLNADLGNGNYQYYHNIANADWQNYIIPTIIKQAQAMGFDGWQGDTPGNLYGNSYNQIKDKAHAFNDSDYYHYFASAVMDYIKKNDPNFAFGLNSVNADGQDAIAKDSNDTFDYSELWSSAFPTYDSIANVIEQNWKNDNKSLVVPVYIYNQWRDAETNGQANDLPKTYNSNAVRQLIATIMANGGSPMVLADGGYLIDDEYYPWMRMENGKQINMDNVLGDPSNGEMKHYFDFDTGYENILQNPDMKANNNYIQVWNGDGVNQGQCINKNDAESNTVYTFSKSNGTVDTINLVNLMNSTNQWQIDDAKDNSSHDVQEQKNLWIKYYPSEQNQDIKHIYISSPDSYYEGKRIEVPFKEMVDPSGNKYVEFKVPDLEIWDLIYMTTQDPQNTIQTPTSYEGNAGDNLVQPSAGNSTVNEKNYPWLNELHPTDKNIIGKGTAGGNDYRVADENYVPNDSQMVFYLPWMTTAQNNAGGSATITLTSGNDKIVFTATPNNDQTTTITIDHNGQVSTYKSYFNIEQGTGTPVKAGNADPGDFLPLEIHTSQNSVSFWINDTLNKPTEVYTVKRDPSEQTQHVTVDVNGIYDGVGGEDDGSVDENYTMSIFTKPNPYDKQTFTDVTDNHPSTPEVIYGPIPKSTPSSNTSSSSDTANSKPTDNSSSSSSSENKPNTSNSSSSSNTTNDKPANGSSTNTSSIKQPASSSSSTAQNNDKPAGNGTNSNSNNMQPSAKPATNSSNNNKPSNSSSVSKPSTGNSDENKPVQKPNGTVAKNSDDTTSGNTESEHSTTDNNHSNVSDSNGNSGKATSAINTTDNSQSSSNTSGLNTTDASSENKTVPAKMQSSVQPSSVANNAPKQTQSVVETAYKPVNRPMTQTEQMVTNANAKSSNQVSSQNNAKKATTQVSDSGSLLSAKAIRTNSNPTLPQTGETANGDALIGISLLGIVGTVGLALEKKRYNI